jgi:hypothetical protein
MGRLASFDWLGLFTHSIVAKYLTTVLYILRRDGFKTTSVSDSARTRANRFKDGTIRRTRLTGHDGITGSP